MLLYNYCAQREEATGSCLLLVSPLPLIALTILDHVLVRIALRTSLESSFGLLHCQ